MQKQIYGRMILIGGIAFLVASAASNPAYSQTLVRDVDKPGYIPYQFSRTADAKALPEVYLSFPDVPAGKRLVIEHVSIRLTLWTGEKGACDLGAGAAGIQGYVTALHTFGAPALLYTVGGGGGFGGGAGNDDAFYSISEAMRFYVDAQDRGGIPLTVHCHREGSPLKPWPVTATVVGYLMDQKAQ